MSRAEGPAAATPGGAGVAVGPVSVRPVEGAPARPAGGPEAPAPPPTAPQPAVGGGPGRPTPARPASWWWRWGFGVVLALLVLAVPVLVYAGARVVLGSSDGRLIRTIDDPAAPGWQAIVEPTPVGALALLDPDGTLDSVAVLVLSGEGRGAVVEVPAATVVVVGGQQVLLSEAYAAGGAEQLGVGLEGVLGVGVPAVEVVPAARWASLVEPVGPLLVDNPDAVPATDAAPGFPRGPVEVPADQVWHYLDARAGDESELNRLARREAFWAAWLAQVGADASRPGIVPGEVDVGLGRFVRALAVDDVDATVLPVATTTLAGRAGPAFAPIEAAVADLVARTVPFPSGPEGTRIRVVVLDGTGRLDHGAAVARVVGASGGEVDKVGNHTDLGVATTQVVFYDEAGRAGVERLRDAIGVGQVVLLEEPGSPVDATIILGEDALERAGAGAGA